MSAKPPPKNSPRQGAATAVEPRQSTNARVASPATVVAAAVSLNIGSPIDGAAVSSGTQVQGTFQATGSSSSTVSAYLIDESGNTTPVVTNSPVNSTTGDWSFTLPAASSGQYVLVVTGTTSGGSQASSSVHLEYP